MTAIIPSVVWTSILAHNAADTATDFMWENPTLQAGMAPAVTMPHTDILQCAIVVVGSSSVVVPFTADLTAGSYNVAVQSGFNNLLVGMNVAPLAGPTSDGKPAIPNGAQITALNQPISGSIEIGDGWSFATTPAARLAVGAWTGSNPASLTAVDEWPSGTMAATVSPSSGITISDWSDPASEPGNGSAMTNNGGQATGVLYVSGFSAGTYTVNVAYTSTDPSYANASAPALTVVCS